MLTNLFFYKMLFMVEILVAEYLFTRNLKRRPYSLVRFLGSSVVLVLVAALFPVLANNAWYSSIMFMMLFGLTLPMLKWCYKERWVNLLFCAMAAYTVQHFAYGVANLLFSIIVVGRSPLLGVYDNSVIDIWTFDLYAAFYMLLYLMCYLVSYWLLYIAFGKRIQKGQDMKIRSVSLLTLFGLGLIINILLNSVIIYVETDFTSAAVNYITNFICCILILHGQFNLLLTKALQNELDIVHQLWHQEKEQYSISKENIDIINMKYHDMRHQIREIGKSKSIEPETIKEIEKSISLYDSMVKTGNEVLDIIITEKNLRCYKNNIILTCLADGTLLNFMNVADLYSLFGNALDNAIDAVLKIDDIDNRIISLKIHLVGNLITINIKNSFSGEIKYDEKGFPITTKDNSVYHGYGIKSISYIVDKYDGNISIVVKNGSFNLNILLPHKQN